MGSSFHGNTSNRNLVPSSHNGNDTRDGLSLNNVTLSMHGGHQSAIEYNEHLDRFEEVPIDGEGMFRGSFPDDNISKHVLTV